LEDLPLLVAWFLSGFRASTGRAELEISQEAMEFLLEYSWPGNIRELRSAIEYAVINAHGPIIHPGELPPEIFGTTAPQHSPEIPALDERQRILQALEQTGGNRMAAARLLGIGRSTLYRKLVSLGIDSE
jgi:DNA-binding NtrC family response regulator